MRHRARSLTSTTAIAAALVLASAPSAIARTSAAPTAYYLALGDSLSIGIQPGPDGVERPTDHGYVDDLYTELKEQDAARGETLQLVKLGCSGEMSTTMVAGGICTYPGAGTQLDAAAQFLAAHRGHVELVTIDIGANDVDGCISATGADATCLSQGFAALTRNLGTITSRLSRITTGSGTRFVGMNYYDPFLAEWLTGPQGQNLATQSVGLVQTLNQTVDAGYQAADYQVADVADAFQITNVSPMQLPGVGQIPRNVAETCELTWMCAPTPIGPNIHANTLGYATIASAFEEGL
jgi:lysophospholipase L1-like esterase